MPKTRHWKGRDDNSLLLAEKKAGILKALAHPIRITVFEVLANGEKTVGELVDLLGEKNANTSRHLAVMRAAGLVETSKEGLNVHYSIKLPCLIPLLSFLDDGVCKIADEQSKMAELLSAKGAK
ncbi:MAG: winged helix-turn-helix transcriptional regulator [Acidobacteria bacterium]|nr:winged helix-turn-helix transcriptional regulator [Acidobacteriota bacterium]